MCYVKHWHLTNNIIPTTYNTNNLLIPYQQQQHTNNLLTPYQQHTIPTTCRHLNNNIPYQQPTDTLPTTTYMYQQHTYHTNDLLKLYWQLSEIHQQPTNNSKKFPDNLPTASFFTSVFHLYGQSTNIVMNAASGLYSKLLPFLLYSL
jgi:hypothetical protein